MACAQDICVYFFSFVIIYSFALRPLLSLSLFLASAHLASAKMDVVRQNSKKEKWTKFVFDALDIAYVFQVWPCRDRPSSGNDAQRG